MSATEKAVGDLIARALLSPEVAGREVFQAVRPEVIANLPVTLRAAWDHVHADVMEYGAVDSTRIMERANGDGGTLIHYLAELVIQDVPDDVHEILLNIHTSTGPATECNTLEDFRGTDLWNARHFVHLHSNKVRYCERRGGWYYFDGKRWTRSEAGEVERLAKGTVRQMYEMAALEPNDARRIKKAQHAERTEAARKLAAMLELAKTEEGIAIAPEAFDAEPWKFNTATGTLDLTTGKLLPHCTEDMLTNLSVAEWRGPNATAPLFEKFLSEAMDGDQEKIDFLQRAAGYTLSGDMREQVFLFLHGPEAAGKGTFIRAIADVMGTYSRPTEIQTFLTARRDAVRNDVASLVGSRLVTASEPEDGQVFDEGLIKILTGQDRTTARFLFREAFEFAATFKLWLQGNHRPHIKSTGGAMWRRLLIVPFTKTVPENRRDKTLGDRFRTPEERAGILAWMVRGCIEWQRAGLRPPASVRAAVADYRKAEDRLAPFLEECTSASEHGQVPAGQLYTAYKAWAEANGERPMSKRALGIRLEEKGFKPGKISGGVRVWNGLFLVDRGGE
jgi:putative DNA primase/helicase